MNRNDQPPSPLAADDSGGAVGPAELLQQGRDHVAALRQADSAGDDERHDAVGDAVAAYRQLAAALEHGLAATVDQPAGEQLSELRRLMTEVVEGELLARLRCWQQVAAAVRRLGERGPTSEVVRASAGEAAGALGFDRVVLSRIDDGWLVAEAVHTGDAGADAGTLARMQKQPVWLEYPLVEVETLRRRRPALLADRGEARGKSAYGAMLDAVAFVVVPVVLDGRVVGFFHADRAASGRPVTTLDRDGLAHFSDGFAHAVERAVLRRRLQAQRQEMRRIAGWAEVRTTELSDGVISLADDRPAEAATAGLPPDTPPSTVDLRELLTSRELDVLDRMAAGDTNASIARALVVSEGTVKFHVKNILRKMQAANRAEATSRYLHLKLS